MQKKETTYPEWIEKILIIEKEKEEAEKLPPIHEKQTNNS